MWGIYLLQVSAYLLWLQQNIRDRKRQHCRKAVTKYGFKGRHIQSEGFLSTILEPPGLYIGSPQIVSDDLLCLTSQRRNQNLRTHKYGFAMYATLNSRSRHSIFVKGPHYSWIYSCNTSRLSLLHRHYISVHFIRLPVLSTPVRYTPVRLCRSSARHL